MRSADPSDAETQPEQAPERSPGRAAIGASERALERAPERAAKGAPQRASDGAPEQPSEQPSEQATDESAASPGGGGAGERARRRSLLLLATAEAAGLGPGLREAGYAVRTVRELAAALKELDRQPHDLILCELTPPLSAAPEQLAALGRHGAPVLALVARDELHKEDCAATLIAAGAYDCLSWPCRAAEVTLALRKAAAREERLGDRAARRFLPVAAAAPATPLAWPGFIATAPRMRELLAQIAKVAAHATGVLLIGESGTGKELLARAVHALSPRRAGPFLAVNCGALPEPLLESLLFGHVRGAFTDAIRDQPGVFAQASGGTLFLDEIGELPGSLQVKLLRVLQERTVQPLGAQAAVKVDVRLVSATLRDLEAEVAAGRFRADLYYRLSIVPLSVPPLRERPEDILPLARYFVHRCAERLQLPVSGLTPAAERALRRHPWPGNVRELENTIERAAVLGESTLIDLPDLPPELAYAASEAPRGRRVRPDPAAAPIIAGSGAAGEAPAGLAGSREPGAAADARRDPASGTEFRLQPSDLSIKLVTRRLEMALIRRALIKTRGNRSAAAKLLELSHRALLYKLREYGLK